MKKLKKTKRNTFFHLLLKNYVFFTITIIIIVFIAMIIGLYSLIYSLDLPIGHPKDQLDLLQSGRYDKLDITELAGSNGKIEILDENNNVIYRSDNKDKNISRYTEKEVEYIPEVNYTGEERKFYTEIIKYDDSKEITLLIRRKNLNYTKDDLGNGWFEVLDKNLNVIYSNGDVENVITSYTDKELKYLTGISSENDYISKYSFTYNNKPYTLILKTINEDIVISRVIELAIINIAIFIGAYFLCTTIFIVWLNKKVKKPIKKLDEAIVSLSDGESMEIINYKGPYEFTQICENFNKMLLKLEESEIEREILESEKKKMLADISHDLKTPITTIQGYSKALADGIIPKDEQDKYLKIIYNKSKHLTDLINVFYEYSKLEHADFKLSLERIDLGEFIRTYVADKYEYIYDVGFEIEVDIPEEELLCNIDEIALKRAFENIISNSIKHNISGTTIGIFVKEVDKYYKVNICDDGVGVPHDIANNIFNAFVVGDESRSTKQGSGLGLAITKKIIEKHNGSIKLISSNEKKFKTVFEILLPKNI